MQVIIESTMKDIEGSLMKILYLITAFKLPEQLIRLVKRLNTDDSSFHIHVDKKSDRDIHRKITEGIGSFENVHIIEPINCYWGEFGQVKPILQGIRKIIENKTEFDYVIQLTGQCYPLKSNQFIADFLQSHAGKSFINYFSLPHPLGYSWTERYCYWHLHLGRWYLVFPRENMFSTRVVNRIWNPLARRITWRRRIPGNPTPYFGGSHWCLSRECILYLDAYVQAHPEYERFFTHFVLFPSEIFYQTILLNSQLKANLIDDDLFYIDFTSHKAHPAILTMKDYDRLMSSNDLFARKFDSTIDGEVLDKIDEVIS